MMVHTILFNSEQCKLQEFKLNYLSQNNELDLTMSSNNVLLAVLFDVFQMLQA